MTWPLEVPFFCGPKTVNFAKSAHLRDLLTGEAPISPGLPKQVFPTPNPIFQGSSRILAIWRQCPIISISTLNFGPWSTKFGGTVRATKKWQRALSRPELWRSGRFYVLPKSGFSPKNTQSPISIWEKGTFFLTQLCPVVARTLVPLRSECFFGPKICFFAIGPQISSMACQ